MSKMAGAVFACALLSGFGLPALAQGNFLREAYFGETHIHTSWSLDAWLFGNRMTDPGDAYKYFKGETIKAPLGYEIKIDTALDFAGVTDHSEYVGVIRLANDPNSPISKIAAAQPLIIRNNSPEEIQRIFIYGTKLLGGPPVKEPTRSGNRTSSSPRRPTSPASSPRSAPTSGPRCRTT
jgi:Protein of unknown function (DUF3604)